MDINRFKNAEGRITDSMSQGYSTRLNDDCFYFQIDEEAKEVFEQYIEYFKQLIAVNYDKTVRNIEFEDDKDFWTVEVDFRKINSKKITKRENWQARIKAIADKVSKNTDRDYNIRVKISNPLYKELKETTFLKSLENEYGVYTSLSRAVDGKHRECTLWIDNDELPF